MSDPKDVTLDVIGKDHTGPATRSAERNFDRLKRAVDKTSAGTKHAEKSTDSFHRSLGRMQGGLSKTGGVLKVAGTAVAGFLGGLALAVPLFNKLTDSSINLNLAVAKSRVVFGENFKSLDKWARKTATSLGFTRVEALSMAGAFGDMASQIGFSASKSAEAARRFVTLAGRVQLMSAGKLDAAAATEALSAAFRGEYDTLQQVVPSISAAAIEEKAAALARKAHGKVTADQAKMLAVLDIVQRGTRNSAGLLATAEGKQAAAIATARARIREQWQDIQAKLLPSLTDLWSALETKVVPQLKAFARWIGSPEGQQAMAKTVAAMKAMIDISIVVGQAFLTMVSVQIHAIERLISVAAKIPGKVGEPFRRALPSIRKARHEVDSLRDALSHLKSKTVTVKFRYVVTGNPNRTRPGGTSGDIALSGGPGGRWAAFAGGATMDSTAPVVEVKEGNVSSQVTVRMDSREIRAICRQEISREQSSAAWRARSGRRRSSGG